MMDENNELLRIGKRMPYKTPNHLFNDIEENVMRQLHREHHSVGRVSRRHPFRVAVLTTAAAACAAVLLVTFKPSMHRMPQPVKTVEQAFDNLSSDDKAYIIEVYQEDIFINQ